MGRQLVSRLVPRCLLGSNKSNLADTSQSIIARDKGQVCLLVEASTPVLCTSYLSHSSLISGYCMQCLDSCHVVYSAVTNPILPTRANR
ncbi:hypothetical protein J6590_035923 [Homalodisca vitripennis]|nr:hypothetical protein J6590_035923 [Homalodisca vitripennis]